jgi:hypothetical protein
MEKKTEEKHTPGPWRVGGLKGGWEVNADYAGREVVTARTTFKTDAAYIVRACNSFPALVEALKAFVSAADHAAAGQPLALYRAKELALLADALTKAGE